MKILAIETSCDDTSIALIEGHDESITLLKEAHASQIDVHKIYGGVVPEVAARKHTEVMSLLLTEIFDKQNPPDAIAVTAGPGLLTSLLVGVETAKTISALTHIPIIRVNHMEGHIYSNWVDREKAPEFPILALIVSGGHTELVLMESHCTFQKIGETVDDAAGECFDKVGKLIGLEYPGGPKISKLAEDGNPEAIQLPRPMIDSDNLNFSFSGLKTAAKIYIEKHQHVILTTKEEGSREDSIGTGSLVPRDDATTEDFCASLEQAIVEVLVSKTLRAIKQHSPKTVILGGGVAANKKLRETLAATITQTDAQFIAPHIPYCMDNAAMIGAAGYFTSQHSTPTKWQDLTADPVWELPS